MKKSTTVFLTLNNGNTVNLKLVKDDYGNVNVVTYKNGDIEYYLLGLSTNGTIYKCSSLPDELGFQLNKSGQIY